MAAAEVCRRHGIGGVSFYKSKLKYGGMEVSEVKQLRSPDDVNTNPKKLLVGSLLVIAVFKGISSKNWRRPTGAASDGPESTGIQLPMPGRSSG